MTSKIGQRLFGSALTLSLLAPAAFAGTDACEVPRLLGDAGLFNLFVYEDAVHQNTDAEGRIALGGGASGEARSSLAHYRIGGGLGAGNRVTLLVNGPLTFEHGTVEPANVIWGRHLPYIAETVAVRGGVYDAPLPAELTAFFDETQAANAALAAELARLAPSQVQRDPAASLVFSTDAADRAVFAVDASVLAAGNAAHELRLTAPAGTLVVVNVAGRDAAVKDFGFTYAGGVDASTVVLNFFEAERLDLSGVGVQGSILAPHALVDFSDGVVHGDLVARALRGNGQLNWIFAACDEPARLSRLITRLGWSG